MTFQAKQKAFKLVNWFMYNKSIKEFILQTMRMNRAPRIKSVAPAFSPRILCFPSLSGHDCGCCYYASYEKTKTRIGSLATRWLSRTFLLLTESHSLLKTH